MKDWSLLTVLDLKAELRKRGLPSSGRKADLIERLEEAEDEGTVETVEEERDDGKVSFICSTCDKKLKIPSAYVGRVRCPACKNVSKVGRTLLPKFIPVPKMMVPMAQPIMPQQMMMQPGMMMGTPHALPTYRRGGFGDPARAMIESYIASSLSILIVMISWFWFLETVDSSGDEGFIRNVCCVLTMSAGGLAVYAGIRGSVAAGLASAAGSSSMAGGNIGASILGWISLGMVIITMVFPLFLWILIMDASWN